jgi:hypothetical protein
MGSGTGAVDIEHLWKVARQNKKNERGEIPLGEDNTLLKCVFLRLLFAMLWRLHGLEAQQQREHELVLLKQRVAGLLEEQLHELRLESLRPGLERIELQWLSAQRFVCHTGLPHHRIMPRVLSLRSAELRRHRSGRSPAWRLAARTTSAHLGPDTSAACSRRWTLRSNFSAVAMASS